MGRFVNGRLRGEDVDGHVLLKLVRTSQNLLSRFCVGEELLRADKFTPRNLAVDELPIFVKCQLDLDLLETARFTHQNFTAVVCIPFVIVVDAQFVA